MTLLAYPRGVIKETIRCDDETAEQVRIRLAGLMAHRPTQAFLSAFCNLSRSTYVDNHQSGASDALVQEGKRRVALFVMACAADRTGSAMEIRNFIEGGNDDAAQ